MGNSRFSDGFLLGALIGGAAVFLLGTKKGNKILKAVTDGGLEGLTDLLENYEARYQTAPGETEKQGSKPVPVPKPKKTSAPVEHQSFDETLETNGHSSTPSRRFFKRNK